MFVQALTSNRPSSLVGMTDPSPSPSPCFSILSSRLLASSTNSLSSSGVSWCPRMDLLACVTQDNTLHVHRLNWQKIIVLPLLIHPTLKNYNTPANQHHSIVTSMAWRPDGKALVLGTEMGMGILISIESKAIVHTWIVGETTNSKFSPSPITYLRWIDWSQQVARQVQSSYIHLFIDPTRSVPLANLTNTPLVDDGSVLFGPLPSLDTVGDLWSELASLASTSSSAAANGRPNLTRSNGGAPSPATTVGTLKGVLHDGFDQPLTTLLTSDADGRVTIRAFGTLPICHLTLTPSPSSCTILRSDFSQTSGVLSVVTREKTTQRVMLHTYVLPHLLFQTGAAQLRHASLQLQQCQRLNEYVQQAVEQCATKWKAARRSFENKVRHRTMHE